MHFHTLSLDVWCSEAIGFIKKLGKNNSLSYPHCSVFPFLSHSVKIATHINFSLLIDTDESNQILTEQNMGKFCFGNNFATISPILLIFELKLKNWISHQIKSKNPKFIENSPRYRVNKNMGKISFGNNFETISPILLVFELKLKNWILRQIKQKNPQSIENSFSCRVNKNMGKFSFGNNLAIIS